MEQEITVSKSGIIIGWALLSVVNEGDAIFHIAQVSAKTGMDAAEDTLDRITAMIEDHALFDENEII